MEREDGCQGGGLGDESLKMHEDNDLRQLEIGEKQPVTNMGKTHPTLSRHIQLSC